MILRLIGILSLTGAFTFGLLALLSCAVVIYADNGAAVNITSRIDSEVETRDDVKVKAQLRDVKVQP